MKIKVLRLFSSISATSSPYVQFTKGFSNVATYPLAFFNNSEVKSRFIRYIQIFQEAMSLQRKHKIEVIHCHNIYLLPVAIGLKFRSCFNIKVVFTMHTSFSLLKTRDLFLLTFLFYFIDTFVSCGSAVRDGLPSYFRENKRSVLIRNSVNLDNLIKDHSVKDRDVSQNLTTHSTEPIVRIYSACRLNAGKNIEGNISLVKALRDLNLNIEYHVFGGGPLENTLQTKYGDKSYILFKGLTLRNDLYSSMQNMDVFISQSTGEGLPVAPLEALLSGKAVILSDIPPHDEFSKFFPKSTLIVKKDTSYYDIEKFLKSWLKAPALVEQEVLNYFHVNRMEKEYINVYKK